MVIEAKFGLNVKYMYGFLIWDGLMCIGSISVSNIWYCCYGCSCLCLCYSLLAVVKKLLRYLS